MYWHTYLHLYLKRFLFLNTLEDLITALISYCNTNRTVLEDKVDIRLNNCGAVRLYVTQCLRTVCVGIFFVLPCIESYTKVDLSTVSFDVPPQEVRICLTSHLKRYENV